MYSILHRAHLLSIVACLHFNCFCHSKSRLSNKFRKSFLVIVEIRTSSAEPNSSTTTSDFRSWNVWLFLWWFFQHGAKAEPVKHPTLWQAYNCAVTKKCLLCVGFPHHEFNRLLCYGHWKHFMESASRWCFYDSTEQISHVKVYNVVLVVCNLV